MSGAAYDEIGVGYTRRRRSEPRIAAQVEAAVLGLAPSVAATVVNVGAGTGSYELAAPVQTVAVEPSATMRDQRAPGSAPCIGAVAEALPFADQTFDVATAFLTVHHAQLPDPVVERGIAALAADLDSGRWHERNADLLERDEIDAGNRLVIAG